MSFRLSEVYDAMIGKTKWALSETAGRDVGVPHTVDFLLLADSSLFGNLQRGILIRNYLLSDVRDDKHGAGGSRLKGELMRWEAQRRGISPEQVMPVVDLKNEYARANGIDF